MTHSASTPVLALLGQMIARAWRVFNNRRQFAELKDWSDEQLKDIGLTRSDVRRALELPFYTDPTSMVNAAKVHTGQLDLRPANLERAQPELRIVGARADTTGQIAA